MNASLVQQIIVNVRAYLQAQPDITMISVSQNDNCNYCQDPAELAVIDEEGSPIGPLLRAVNTIADAIAVDFPRVSVSTLAYQYTRPPPKVTVPRPNVIIRLCDIEGNFAAPLTHPSNAAFAKDLATWRSITKHQLLIWDYVTNFNDYVLPFPNWYVLGPNVRFFLEHGVSGVFEESSYNSVGADMADLKNYLLSRVLWDPSTDDLAIIGEFLQGYYGVVAAPFIQQYMGVMTGAIAETGFYMGESFGETAGFLTPLALLTGASTFANAEKALAKHEVEPLLSKHMARVKRAKLSVHYALLLRWDELKAFAEVCLYTCTHKMQMKRM
jgi:hypothetical protein